jgi:DHA2 family multidrug resistance protein
MSCFFIPLLSILLSGLPGNRIASASGLSNFLRILAGSFGTSISITLWSRREAFHHNQLAEKITAYDPTSQQALTNLHDLGLNQSASYQQLANTITHQAYMLSTNDIFWLSGWLFLSLLVLIWFAKPPFMGSNKDAGGAH